MLTERDIATFHSDIDNLLSAKGYEDIDVIFKLTEKYLYVTFLHKDVELTTSRFIDASLGNDRALNVAVNRAIRALQLKQVDGSFFTSRCKRLQSSDWHAVKSQLTLVGLFRSTNDNLCGKFVDANNTEYIHWLNDEEKQAVRAAAIGKLRIVKKYEDLQ